MGASALTSPQPLITISGWKSKPQSRLLGNLIQYEVGVVKEDGFSMPVNPSSQETLGHCFIEFNSPQSSRYPGSPSLLSPVTEEDEEPVHSDETSANDHDDIM
ncbi:hypothetical protein ABKV19_016461 [Rosa sericea]